jgi:segregation and condensation protein A
MEEAYKVKLDIFEGPLDLLLYLVRKDEVEIHEVSMERITKQYLEYIDTFKLLNIDLASEFIVMAANLIYIKSRTLLPKQDQLPVDEEDEGDPRWELIRQLIEYKKFKDAAGFLQERSLALENLFPATPEPVESPPPSTEMPDVNIFDLIRAFQKVVDKFEPSRDYEIVDERYTVSDKIDFLLQTVPIGDSLRFTELFRTAASRDEVIVTFIAILELSKLKHLRIYQDHLLGEIVITRQESTMLITHDDV